MSVWFNDSTKILDSINVSLFTKCETERKVVLQFQTVYYQHWKNNKTFTLPDTEKKLRNICNI